LERIPDGIARFPKQAGTPVHIEFQGMEPQEVLRAAIARHVAVLEKRFGRITACRVVLKGPGQHHRTGGLFEVHIRLALPDEKEVNIGRKPDADEPRRR